MRIQRYPEEFRIAAVEQVTARGLGADFLPYALEQL